MARRLIQVCLSALAVVGLIVSVAIACGPFFPEATFIESSHPDSLNGFAAGRLGILQSSYSISYLVVAYRYLSGRPFDPDGQKRLLALWDKYLNPQVEQTASARFATTGGGYQSYQNCLSDALETADRTRQARSQQFGAESVAFTSWSQAQDAVFRNCDAGQSANPAIPAAADAALPDIIRKDRDYQIAAAYFYAGQWDDAKRRFLTISQDSTSPWQAIAGLVAARCDIRAGSLGTDDPDDRKERYGSADTQLKKIIADPAFSSVSVGAEQLRGYVEFRTDPDGRLVELSKTIERGTSLGTLADNLDDFTKLFRGPRPLAKWQALRQQSPMLDWIFSFANGDTEAARLSRWQETKSLPWLVAAMTYAQPDTPGVSALLDAAGAVPQNSPAYLTVAFQRDRLLIAQKNDAQARADLDRLLKSPPDELPPSARNALLALRMHSAANLDELLKFAAREPARIDNENQQQTAPEFDVDAALVLTQELPTRLLAKAAAASSVDEDLRTQIAEEAWVRSVLLDQEQVARQLVPTLSRLDPSLSAGLKAYDGAPSAAERKFAAVFLILHQPELHPYVYAGPGRQSTPGGIDSYRDNWWCSVESPPNGPGNGNMQFYHWHAGSGLHGPLAALTPAIGLRRRISLLTQNAKRLKESGPELLSLVVPQHGWGGKSWRGLRPTRPTPECPRRYTSSW